jgi:hypothetical protein
MFTAARARNAAFSALVLAASAHAAEVPQEAGKAAGAAGAAAAPRAEPWREAEQGILAHQVQLTFADRFIKAGESYFSPDDSTIIFQAVERPRFGEAADEFYAMFVADVVRDGSKRITGLSNARRISPPGSANTCGWFFPGDSSRVIFGSTLAAPSESTPPGFQRATGRYKWMFPPEMRIIEADLRAAGPVAPGGRVWAGDGRAYCAEGSWSPDGRHLLYCSLESNEGDLFAIDTRAGQPRPARLVSARGYDGGPFFSPDGRRICYRSDRRGDNHLQLFVADLAFNESGAIIGIEREYQLTDNGHVNWCPFWTRDGRRLVYGTSAMGHENYEVFMCDADPGNLPGSTGTIRYGTGQRRITHAERADILPAFNADGRWMIWTSQRGSDGESQLWAAEFVLDADSAAAIKPAAREEHGGRGDDLHVQDPQTGMIFVYNRRTHELSLYDPATHEARPVTDPKEMERAMRLFREKGD